MTQNLVSVLKRVILVIAFPFIFLYYVLSFPFKIAYFIITDKKEKARKVNVETEFDVKKVGLLLFPDLKENFEEFLKLYAKNKAAFKRKYRQIQIDNAKLSQIDLIQSFGDIHKKMGFIDWKGEENVMEIEEFIETQVNNKIEWINSGILRASVSENKQQDGKYILKLFRAIDKDLQHLNFRLLFLNIDGDGYVFLPVSSQTFEKVFEIAPDQFENVYEL